MLKYRLCQLCHIKRQEYIYPKETQPQCTITRNEALDQKVKCRLQKIWCSLGGSLNQTQSSDNIPASPETLEDARAYYELYTSLDLMVNASKFRQFSDLLEKALENGVLAFLMDAIETVVEPNLSTNSKLSVRKIGSLSKFPHQVGLALGSTRKVWKQTTFGQDSSWLKHFLVLTTPANFFIVSSTCLIATLFGLNTFFLNNDRVNFSVEFPNNSQPIQVYRNSNVAQSVNQLIQDVGQLMPDSEIVTNQMQFILQSELISVKWYGQEYVDKTTANGEKFNPGRSYCCLA